MNVKELIDMLESASPNEIREIRSILDVGDFESRRLSGSEVPRDLGNLLKGGESGKTRQPSPGQPPPHGQPPSSFMEEPD